MLTVIIYTNLFIIIMLLSFLYVVSYTTYKDLFVETLQQSTNKIPE